MEKNKTNWVSFLESSFPMTLIILIATVVAVSTFVIDLKLPNNFEEKKKNASQSLIALETERIENIDKQLTLLYKNSYSNNDSLLLNNFTKEIQFLKEQRNDAIKSIAETNKHEDNLTQIFLVVLAILSVTLATLFTSSFKPYSIRSSTVDRVKKDTENQLLRLNLPIIDKFEDIKERIKDESARLNKQAVINLYLCFFIAFAFMGFVGYTTLYKSDPPNTWNVFIMLYIPKLTGILGLLTMFLYFVRLYKANVIDAKYYQNELTNIEFRYLSLMAGFEIKNDDLISNLIKDFAMIDRNSILLKDQTSLELERIKIENDLNKSYLSQIWELKTIFTDKKGENT